ncbi:GGDEF domain-containing protein [uncultured Umboniibacter sp.]|uniref:GGDEF domain-containing protein n=1 Tax=uncultured Umboniibacter sp. TaxID=1798917 RepID=UPI00262DE1DD|nr:GGDEF domain-containing protein [uncultured Umboniibacter sp.]
MNWSRNLPLILATALTASSLLPLIAEIVPALEVYGLLTLLVATLLALTLRQTRVLFLSLLVLWTALFAPKLIALSTHPIITENAYKILVTLAISGVMLFTDGPFRRKQSLFFALLIGVISLLGFGAFVLNEEQLMAWGATTPLAVNFNSFVELDALILCLPVVCTLINFLITRRLDIHYIAVSVFALALLNSPDIPQLWMLLITVQSAFILVLLLTMSQRVWRDSLTGLPGRQRLDSDLKRMPVGSLAAFVDIDHFKKFNDKYGHANGDLVLQAVAKELARCRFAQAYRYGGEEFVMLAKPTEVKRFTEQLNSLRERIAAKKFQLSVSVAAKPAAKKTGSKNSSSSTASKKANKAKGVSVRISAGIGKLLLSMSHQDWLKQADDALYQAKAAGRNCVVVTKTLTERRVKRR